MQWDFLAKVFNFWVQKNKSTIQLIGGLMLSFSRMMRDFHTNDMNYMINFVILNFNFYRILSIECSWSCNSWLVRGFWLYRKWIYIANKRVLAKDLLIWTNICIQSCLNISWFKQFETISKSLSNKSICSNVCMFWANVLHLKLRNIYSNWELKLQQTELNVKRC